MDNIVKVGDLVTHCASRGRLGIVIKGGFSHGDRVVYWFRRSARLAALSRVECHPADNLIVINSVT